ncbi:MAG TPA: acetate--CoA ligase [Polyangia bacterium]|nr:acetate--CoA ligase [Polyangia bacterium]
MADDQQRIESHLDERRVFPPPVEFAARARVASLEEYERLRDRARDDPEGFWRELAHTLDWLEPFHSVLEESPPFVKWFTGGKLNLSANCLDRHLAERGDRRAIVWEGEPGDARTLTYRELHAEVCRAAGALRSLGVSAGDRVAIYLPMIPELAISLLACARIGATHSVIFGGFSAEAIRDRVNDAGARVIITADGGWRRGKVVALKVNVDAALDGRDGHGCPTVEKVLVVTRTKTEITMRADRDVAWADALAKGGDGSPAALDAEHPLFILYTSGSTGKPKGVLHATGGYSVWAGYTTRVVFDLRDDDVYWCTADIGWVTGHSYVVYGPLLNGATTLMYEGAPDSPDKDRFWQMIARHRVSIFYTAPTAIRAFMRWGDEFPARHDLSSLRLLGTVGEPINPEAWMWYRRAIGGDRCPIVDTWWQTETGGILISPLPGATPTKPGSCTRPLPGIEADVVDRQGVSCPPNVGGFLVIKRPWPSMLRTIFGDPDRYVKSYFSEISIGGKPVYFAGDGARKDADGYFWVMGRVDDVINVAGHRLGTMEIESALVGHPDVAEAAVVGRPDELKGQAVVAFVTLRGGKTVTPEIVAALGAHVVKEIGALARPEEIRFTDALPKTRSGKIMRRLLKEIAAGGQVRGDVTTLEDMNVLNRLAQQGSDEE